MTDRYPQPIFLDATVLSNFASTDSISFLVDLLDSPAVVPAVRDEIEHGQTVGHDYLDTAVEAFDETVSVVDAVPSSDLTAIGERLDVGEAESMLSAIEYGGTLATDDLAARRIATDRNLPVTGSIGLLVVGIERDGIDRTTANEWLDTWRRKRGYYAPVDSVGEVIDNETE